MSFGRVLFLVSKYLLSSPIDFYLIHSFSSPIPHEYLDISFPLFSSRYRNLWKNSPFLNLTRDSSWGWFNYIIGARNHNFRISYYKHTKIFSIILPLKDFSVRVSCLWVLLKLNAWSLFHSQLEFLSFLKERWVTIIQRNIPMIILLVFG